MKNDETFLDYNYSKNHQIILSKNKESSVLFYTEDAELSLIAYIQKKYDDSFVLSKLEFSDFNKKLSDIFTENSSNSSDLVQGVDESIDLDTLASDLPKTEDLLDDSNEAPVIKLINAVLAEAIKDGASDIHIEPYEEYLSIRFRVDGILKEKLKPSSRVSSLLNARIKIMSNLDIAERRVPQDGRMSLKLGEKWVDIRVSTLPSSYGERIVLRLLDKAEASLDLKELGMNDQIMQNYLD